MKVHALANAPERVYKELADIQFLLGLPGVDAQEVRGYFERHGLAGRYDELAEPLRAARPPAADACGGAGARGAAREAVPALIESAAARRTAALLHAGDRRRRAIGDRTDRR
jgi:hypothetical protein